MRSARGPFCLFIRYGFVSSTILRVDGYVQAMLSKPALLTCGVCPVLSSLPAPALPQGCYRVLPSVTITPKGRGARNTCAACRARPLYWRRRQDVARKPPASLRALLAPCPSPLSPTVLLSRSSIITPKTPSVDRARPPRQAAAGTNPGTTNLEVDFVAARAVDPAAAWAAARGTKGPSAVTRVAASRSVTRLKNATRRSERRPKCARERKRGARSPKKTRTRDEAQLEVRLISWVASDFAETREEKKLSPRLCQ